VSRPCSTKSILKTSNEAWEDPTLINNRTSRQQPSSTNPEPWVDEHCDRLYRYALVRVCGPEVAEHLVQETLLAAIGSREKFGGCSSERSWLVGIVKSKIVDYYRKLGRVVDASVFPSSEAVNSALSVIANALRVGDHLLGRVN
jgi:DNA-directed RNA polymerase specialized sigma24 family protein